MTKSNDTHIDLDTFWPYQTVVLADQISRYTLEVVRSEAGLNQSQWRVLAAVADQPGRTAAEVTAVTPMDKTIVSRAVHSLIDSGLIKKIPSQDDKRRSSLEMTKLGTNRYTKIAKKLNETMMAANGADAASSDFVKKIKEFRTRMKMISPTDD